MAYSSWSVVFGEQPSASKWNILGSNDASFNDGTGIGNGVITSEHLNATIACKAFRNAAYIVPTALTKFPFDAESFDLGADFDTANSRFVAPVTGYYQVNLSILSADIGDGQQFLAHIYANGALYSQGKSVGSAASSDPSVNVSDIVSVSAGQYIEAYTTSSNTFNIAVGATSCFMSIYFIGV